MCWMSVSNCVVGSCVHIEPIRSNYTSEHLECNVFRNVLDEVRLRRNIENERRRDAAASASDVTVLMKGSVK